MVLVGSDRVGSTILQQLFTDKREEKIELLKAITVGTDEFQLTPLPQVPVAASLHGYNHTNSEAGALCTLSMNRKKIGLVARRFASKQLCLTVCTVLNFSLYCLLCN